MYYISWVFYTSVSWWSFTGVWMTASLFKSPGLFSVFRSILAMLSSCFHLFHPHTKLLLAVPSAPITTGIIVTFIFHVFFFRSLARFKYLFRYSFSSMLATTTWGFLLLFVVHSWIFTSCRHFSSCLASVPWIKMNRLKRKPSIPLWVGTDIFFIFLRIPLRDSKCISACGSSSIPSSLFFTLISHSTFLLFSWRYSITILYRFHLIAYFSWVFPLILLWGVHLSDYRYYYYSLEFFTSA